jgi:DNA-binding response OmpR family regulator
VRVVLLNNKPIERDAMSRTLQAAGLRVDAFGDADAAAVAIAREPANVVVATLPPQGGRDLVRLFRTADITRSVYLLTVLDGAGSARELAELLDAGAHDFMRRPIADAELVERVRAPSRLVRWARRVKRRAVYDLSGCVDFRELDVWPHMGMLVAEDLSQLVSRPLEVSSGWPERLMTAAHAATIPLSLAADQAELRVSVAIDGSTAASLGASLLEDSGANAVDDLLRELANTAGGAIKRAALLENVTLTTGLPVNESQVRCEGTGIEAWHAVSEGSDACFGIVCESRSRENQMVLASKLREGMVLAHDVRTESGVLLVTAGSRLTGTTAGRLADMLGDRMLVEVAYAA